MKTEKLITILVVSIAIILILIAFKTTERIIEGNKQKEQVGNNQGGNEQELTTLKPSPESEEAAEESTEVTGGEGVGSGGTKWQNRTDLPLDINTRPCSFYFEDYGVCAGVCPSGTCTTEGNSCYCR